MVDQRTQIPIDLSESVTSPFTGEPSISNMLTNSRAVLAFDKTVIVFLIGTGASEADYRCAELVDGLVDELTTGI